MLQDEPRVAAARTGAVDALPDAKWQALLAWLARVNDEPASVRLEHVEDAKAAGWSESALYDALTVVSAFNFFNRWVDGAGVPDVPKGFYEGVLARQGDFGYRMT